MLLWCSGRIVYLLVSCERRRRGVFLFVGCREGNGEEG